MRVFGGWSVVVMAAVVKTTINLTVMIMVTNLFSIRPSHRGSRSCRRKLQYGRPRHVAVDFLFSLVGAVGMQEATLAHHFVPVSVEDCCSF